MTEQKEMKEKSISLKTLKKIRETVHKMVLFLWHDKIQWYLTVIKEDRVLKLERVLVWKSNRISLQPTLLNKRIYKGCTSGRENFYAESLSVRKNGQTSC